MVGKGKSRLIGRVNLVLLVGKSRLIGRVNLVLCPLYVLSLRFSMSNV